MTAVLTAKQEAFALAYVESGDATAAYKAAGYSQNATSKTINECASRLLRNARVMERLTELRSGVAGATQLTLQGHLADLRWLREKAAWHGKFAAAVQAEIARGKAVGFYVERIAGTLEVTEKTDLSALSEEELRTMYAMLTKAGASSQTLQ